MQAFARFAFLFLPAFFLLVSGCAGNRRAPVSGKVTLENQEPKLAGLFISFVGSDGQAVTAEVGADGTFKASGVLVGENKIAFNVNTPPEEGLQPPKPGPDGTVDPAAMEAFRKKTGSQGSVPAPVSPLPPRYRDPGQSGLKFVVEAGESNTYNVDLKK